MSELKIVEKIVVYWRKTDKYYCPECGKKVSYPEYICNDCNVKLKLKMKFHS